MGVDSKGRKMCMNQMRRVFSTCRVPGVFRDQLMTQFRTGMCALGQVYRVKLSLLMDLENQVGVELKLCVESIVTEKILIA